MRSNSLGHRKKQPGTRSDRSRVICEKMAQLYDMKSLQSLCNNLLCYMHCSGCCFFHYISWQKFTVLLSSYASLWPPCIADADIIFLPCGFFLLFLFLA